VNAYRAVVQTYMDALGRGDYAAIKELFDPDARVISPFGEIAAGPFFDEVAEASETNVITPIDIFLSASGGARAIAYFQYEWTAKGGTPITFKAIDHFTFSPGSGLVSSLDVIYDTHPIRAALGDELEPS
jgi:hypothetical protein